MSSSSSFRSVFGRGPRLSAASPFVLHLSAPFGTVTHSTHHGSGTGAWGPLSHFLGLSRRVKVRAVTAFLVLLALLFLLLDALNLGPAFLSSRHANHAHSHSASHSHSHSHSLSSSPTDIPEATTPSHLPENNEAEAGAATPQKTGAGESGA